MPEQNIEPEAKKLKEDEQVLSPTQQNTFDDVPQPARGPGETPPNPLSKNQQKKQLKLARYEELKKQRRIKERERQKEKRQQALAQGLPTRMGPSRKELKRKQISSALEAPSLKVAIDLDYDDLMHERDVAKCVKQCLRIYTINRRAQSPCELHFTGIKENGRIHAGFKRNDGWQNWHLKYHFNATHTDIFPKEQLIYLTSESDAVMERLQPDCIYVIGGLVDHNHHKGLCYKRASERGLRTARLPLSEHVDMKTRSVLSTFHVFEILMRIAEGKTWPEAILQTIPMRKGAVAKEANETKEQAIDDQRKGIKATSKKTDFGQAEESAAAQGEAAES